MIANLSDIIILCKNAKAYELLFESYYYISDIEENDISEYKINRTDPEVLSGLLTFNAKSKLQKFFMFKKNPFLNWSIGEGLNGKECLLVYNDNKGMYLNCDSQNISIDILMSNNEESSSSEDLEYDFIRKGEDEPEPNYMTLTNTANFNSIMNPQRRDY